MMNCSVCDSLDIVKHGFNIVKDEKVQKYKCHACKKIFSHSNKLLNGHLPSEIVNLGIDLYLKGLSYRVIRQQIKEQFGITISHVSIYKWIQDNLTSIKTYIDTLKPKLSTVWQMDETFIQFKGRMITTKLSRGNGYWCWICIDTGTRFILDMCLTLDRMLPSGIEFFERIKSFTNQEPEVVATDGLLAYNNCLNTYYPNTTHLKLKLISLKPNTSFIERYNGTVKNRTKTMRCFDSFNPCQNTLTAFQIYYNFLRPHEALNGQTPAQEAGIQTEFPKRWISLINQARMHSLTTKHQL